MLTIFTQAGSGGESNSSISFLNRSAHSSKYDKWCAEEMINKYPQSVASSLHVPNILPNKLNIWERGIVRKSKVIHNSNDVLPFKISFYFTIVNFSSLNIQNQQITITRTKLLRISVKKMNTRHFPEALIVPILPIWCVWQEESLC